MKNEIELLLTNKHVKEQGLRFLRIFCFALIPQLIALPAHAAPASALLSLVVAAAETAYRQVVPVVPTDTARVAAATAQLAASAHADAGQAPVVE